MSMTKKGYEASVEKKDELADYLSSIKEQVNQDKLMASTSLSTAALASTQSAFIRSGFLDKDGNVNLNMTTPEKIEFFESSNNNMNWFAKLMDAYQKGSLSPQSLESTLSNSTDAITNALFNLHEQIASLPHLGQHAASKDEFTVGILLGTTIVLSGITASQLPAAKDKVLESYHSTKQKFAKLMDGGTQDAKPEEIHQMLTEANSEIKSYANGAQQCDAMSGLITSLKLAISTKYYAEAYNSQAKDKVSSICHTVKNFFDEKLGLEKKQKQSAEFNEVELEEVNGVEASEQRVELGFEEKEHLSVKSSDKMNSLGGDLKSYLDSIKEKVSKKKLDKQVVNNKSKDLKM
ncbi:hypothetical protein [Pseudoalteromonas piscicida]|uniref:hypothetical protein n=1 Tax=Pseudoalteromonas piscicida TaxID=43662 RepID=UPI0032BF431A